MGGYLSLPILVLAIALQTMAGRIWCFCVYWPGQFMRHWKKVLPGRLSAASCRI